MSFPFFRVAFAALIPLFLFILSCSNPSGSTAPSQKVTFNHNYGSSPQSTVKNVQEGSKATAPDVSRPGWRILQWNTKADGSGTDWDFTKDTVKEALTLYAQWAEGQTHTSGNPEPAAPTRARMAFLGWYTSTAFTDFTKRVDFANQPSGTFNMYPKFVSATGYTIAADGTLSSVPSTVSAAATVEIPYNVNEIAVKKLQNTSASSSTSIFGSTIFNANNTVTTVYLPTRNLETIGDDAFYRVKGMTSLTIPGNVTTIGHSAFRFSNLKNLTLSVGLEKIEYGAFRQTKIESVTIPSSVTSMGNFSFGGALPTIQSTVTSVRVEALTPPSALASTGTLGLFHPVPAGLSIQVPPDKAAAYKAAAGWNIYADKITEYSN